MSVDVLYVSPHSDDVAFSAAGQVAQDVGSGARVGVLTVFELPASEKHSLFGDRATRRAEDDAYAALARVERFSAGFEDAVVRRRRYRKPHVLLKPSTQDEKPLVLAIRARIEAFVREGCRRVVAPLGIGEHIDHQLAHEAARGVSGAELVFYEDTPYVLTPFELARRLSRLGLQAAPGDPAASRGGAGAPAHVDPTVVRGSVLRELAAVAETWRSMPLLDMSFGVTPGARRPWWLGMARSMAIAYLLLPCILWWPRRVPTDRWATASVVRGPAMAQTKLAAIGVYASQWPAFQPTLDAWRRALETYAHEFGEDGIVERVWRLPEP